MIPPSTVATLRTSQIFVAFIAQVIEKPLPYPILELAASLQQSF